MIGYSGLDTPLALAVPQALAVCVLVVEVGLLPMAVVAVVLRVVSVEHSRGRNPAF